MRRRGYRSIPLLLLSILVGSCHAPEGAQLPEDPRERYALRTLGELEYPADNPKNKNRFVLGWRLFYDPILSATKDVACGTCHHAKFAMADGRALSLGVHSTGLGPGRTSAGSIDHETARNSPSIVNAGYIREASGHSPLFWDGRARSLEEQSLFPIRDPNEMLGDEISPLFAIDSVIARLRSIKLYEIYFREAFVAEADSVAKGLLPSTITASTLARALASFQREVVSKNSRYDQFVKRQIEFTPEETQGLEIFFGKAGCGGCHSGPMFSDFRLYGQGVGSTADRGAGNHRFRTPSLRNLETTAPYMHDGTFKTIDDVIEYYDRGIALNPQLPKSSIDPRFRPLGLTDAEKRALKAFLLTLRDDSWEDFAVPPSVVPSNLDVPR
ncbi:MAG TPA: cytochrome c peroxidase [Candidatus Kapabacteria bacterium]|nr:cytochrome c peroxidase [Candidatus Kapabacteria bacterium]